MKFLKIPLGDGKEYTVRTFSVTQQLALKKDYKKYQKLEEEAENIQFETEADGKKKKVDGKWVYRESFSVAQKERLEKIEEEMMDFGVDIFRKCLSHNHNEFIKVENKEEDNKIKEKALDLVDANDLKKIIQFAFTGIYIQEKSLIVVDLNKVEVENE